MERSNVGHDLQPPSLSTKLTPSRPGRARTAKSGRHRKEAAEACEPIDDISEFEWGRRPADERTELGGAEDRRIITLPPTTARRRQAAPTARAAMRATSNFDRRHSRPRATGRKSGNVECHQCAGIMDHRGRHPEPLVEFFSRREQVGGGDSPSTDSSALTHRPRFVSRRPPWRASSSAIVGKQDTTRIKNARAL